MLVPKGQVTQGGLSMNALPPEENSPMLHNWHMFPP